MSGLKLLVSDHHGVYIPRVFTENFDHTQWGLTEEDIQTITEGPDADWYWDEWSDVLDKAGYKDAEGNEWHLFQDGDLWAYCESLMTDEEYENFFGEPRS